MQIEIPNDQYEKLTVVANAAGFSNVAAFVESLAEIPTIDTRGELSEEERRVSAAECDQAIFEFAASGGISLDQAEKRTREYFKKLVE